MEEWHRPCLGLPLSPAPCPGLRQPLSGQGAPRAPVPTQHVACLPPSWRPAARAQRGWPPSHALQWHLWVPMHSLPGSPTHIRFFESPQVHFRKDTWTPKSMGSGRGREDPRTGHLLGLQVAPSEQPRGGRRQPQDQPGREAVTGWWQWQAVGRGPGAYLRRSCRLPAAGGRAGSGSRSPRRCCSTDPRSPRCQRHTHSRLRGGEAGERHTGTCLATHGHPKASHQ